MSAPKPYFETQDGRVRIYHGDAWDLAASLPEVDHLLSDPPYSATSHANHEAGRDWGAEMDGLERARLAFTSITPDALRGLLGALNVRRWAVFTMDEEISAALRLVPPVGWKYMRTCLWIKPGAAPQFTGDRPGMGYEPIVAMHREGGRSRWNGGGKHGIWTAPAVRGEHPTEKPIALYRSLVEDFTDSDELILDPFMGSGTTLRAAYDLGRRAIGIDVDERWCELAAKRLSQLVLL